MRRRTLLAVLVLLASATTAFADDWAESWDGLVRIKPKRMDAAYVLPGADFRPYTKIMIDPAHVEFRKDWLKSMNETKRDVSSRISEEDAAQILSAARSNFDDLFKAAYEKAGLQVVTTPGPDTLRLATGVINLYLNAPDPMQAGRSTSYTANAGEATLVLEARDSSTGALLGRVVDRRETQDSHGLQVTTRVTNLADFRTLFERWATISVKGLNELKELSPVPEDLKPGQKLK
jgi:hypothetical protein